ncbi:iron-sulfur cluster assembly scaffold protein [uncultured Pseudodesulfovibrio sp.]|uniref:iron-sulfur cluster assembly scaffold protein n=1 Tax=uncultured Pseudodesulfovibrio sp. TaxID=2035858 RepID=UPI0029C92DDF|nr:iron-sulfur cluster assembly scaffold protein [uncultured Pseudodesulfovibrio sp.]
MPSFDDIVNELQGKINEETIEAYGQAGFERWQNQPYRGKPAKANYEGASTGSCGDTIRIFLHIEDDRVHDAGFATDGCGSSTISGSMAAELAVNKPCDELPPLERPFLKAWEDLTAPETTTVRPTHCTRLGGLL